MTNGTSGGVRTTGQHQPLGTATNRQWMIAFGFLLVLLAVLAVLMVVTRPTRTDPPAPTSSDPGSTAAVAS